MLEKSEGMYRPEIHDCFMEGWVLRCFYVSEIVVKTSVSLFMHKLHIVTSCCMKPNMLIRGILYRCETF